MFFNSSTPTIVSIWTFLLCSSSVLLLEVIPSLLTPLLPLSFPPSSSHWVPQHQCDQTPVQAGLCSAPMADSPLNHSWPSFSRLWMKRWSFKRGNPGSASVSGRLWPTRARGNRLAFLLWAPFSSFNMTAVCHCDLIVVCGEWRLESFRSKLVKE